MTHFRRRNWTAADYESQEVLHMLGHRDAVTRVNRARRGHPVRRTLRAVRSCFTSRRTPTQPAIDWDAARAAGEAINRGDVDTADRIVQATANPRMTAFAAFRFVDVH